MLRIKEIQITGIGPIRNLKLYFDDNFNIVCGQNGIGKTTILDCLAQSFSLNHISVKKMAGIEKGNWNIKVDIDGSIQDRSIDTLNFLPSETNVPAHGFYLNSNDIIVFRTHRDVPYKKIDSLSSDPQKEIVHFATETMSGSLPDNLKNWFVNRYIFSAHPGFLDTNQDKNRQLAQECFSILNSDIKFSRVLPDSFDILLNTPIGEIYFEYLSSGYKSCLALLLGLIKEIEFRYKNPSKYIKDFEGIVFIDELDLHLHPEWQAKIYEALKTILPKAQVFTSTHSPHIIQVAKPNEIIALTFDEKSDIKLNPIINKEYGCQGWTVEEILKDVMGMSETRTEKYLETIESFNRAIESENSDLAYVSFNTLDKMLHPENVLRKVLKIQLTGIIEDDQT